MEEDIWMEYCIWMDKFVLYKRKVKAFISETSDPIHLVLRFSLGSM